MAGRELYTIFRRLTDGVYTVSIIMLNQLTMYSVSVVPAFPGLRRFLLRIIEHRIRLRRQPAQVSETDVGIDIGIDSQANVEAL
jgi:hypothetical protein